MLIIRNFDSTIDFILIGKKFHCKVNTIKISAFCRKIAGLHCTHGYTNRIKLFKQLFAGNIFANFSICSDNKALIHHQVNTAVNKYLV